MDGTSSVRAISECFIKPKHVVEESKKAFYLGSFELRQMSQCYLQSGLLFDKFPTDEEGGIDLFLMRLKQSLSSTLEHFYPLAGQLETKVDEDEHNSFIFIDCNKGLGAKFIHATAIHVGVQDIVSSADTPSIVESFFDFGRILTNYDSHDEPILVIQVTELIDGIFIGASVNHAVVDGNSYWHFMSSWSETFESKDTMKISRVPILERWFPEGYGPIIKIPHTHPEEFITRYEMKNVISPLREMIFSFSHESMAALKAKANADCNNVTSNKISSFQALSALLWRSIARSRCLKSDEDITCTIVADCRSRVKPPLSQNYFGSFIAPIRKTVKVGELLGNNLGWGALLLHQGVQECTEERVYNDFVEWIKAPYIAKCGESIPNFILIGGLPGANAYSIKFGLGEPVTIRAGSNKYDGRVFLEPGKQGKGSVTLHIWLLPHTGSAFQKDSELLSFCSPSSI